MPCQPRTGTPKILILIPLRKAFLDESEFPSRGSLGRTPRHHHSSQIIEDDLNAHQLLSRYGVNKQMKKGLHQSIAMEDTQCPNR